MRIKKTLMMLTHHQLQTDTQLAKIKEIIMRVTVNVKKAEKTTKTETTLPSW